MRESALVDKDNLPDLTERFVRSAYLLIHMIRKSLCRILVAQTPCHILTYEPGLALLVNGEPSILFILC